MKKAIIAMALLAFCHSVSAGQDKLVNDALPLNAALYFATVPDRNDHKEIDGNTKTVMQWHVHSTKLPCARIMAAHWWQKHKDLVLLLKNCQYGCDFFPQPNSGVRWTFPQVGAHPIRTKNSAEEIAAYCGVPFKQRD